LIIYHKKYSHNGVPAATVAMATVNIRNSYENSTELKILR